MAGQASDAGRADAGRRTALQQARLAGLRAIGTRYSRAAGRPQSRERAADPSRPPRRRAAADPCAAFAARCAARPRTSRCSSGRGARRPCRATRISTRSRSARFPALSAGPRRARPGLTVCSSRRLPGCAAGSTRRSSCASITGGARGWPPPRASRGGSATAGPRTRPFLTEAVPYEAGRHEALQNARLLEALAPGIERDLGPSRYTVRDEDASVGGGAVSADAPGRRVAIHPGAGAAVKQWPVHQWASVAAALHAAAAGRNRVDRRAGRAGADRGHRGAGCRSTCWTWRARRRSASSRQSTAACDVVLGSDSGPLHLAVAAGAKTVHLYGPVPAAKFGPWGQPARNVVLTSPFACVPCDRLDWPAHALAAARVRGCNPAGGSHRRRAAADPL